MPRRPRSALGDGVFHITARGNAGMKVFLDDADRRAYIGPMHEVASRHALTLIAYCLMPNHVHLVVRARGVDLSQGMSALNGGYAQRFNRRHGRYGHLWQGRYSASLIDEKRRVDVREYVMNNPVRAGLIAEGAAYPWSRILIPE